MNNRILVVDDDNFILECFQRVLSRHFAIDTATGPWEGLHAISTKGPYAVVVSDMSMPRMNGIEFLTKAKALSPGIVGILLSGNFDPNEGEPVPTELVFKILEKPLPFEELVGFLNEALAHYHSGPREAGR